MEYPTIFDRSKWIESLIPGQVSTGHLTKGQHIKSISVQLSEYNSGKGRDKGVFVHAKYDKPNLNVTLVAVSWEERERELADPRKKDEWRKLLQK